MSHMSLTKTPITEKSIIVNTSTLKTREEYVCWLDMMGTKSNMSDSFEKSTNFISNGYRNKKKAHRKN